MDTSGLIVQDLTDILQMNKERVEAYNTSAYRCENLQLKMLLHRELDHSRDCILALKRELRDHYEITTDVASTGQLFAMWADFKPFMVATDLALCLECIEMTDLLTLQCYSFVIVRPYLAGYSKSLLEFQYQTSLSIYQSLKAFRGAYSNSIQNAMDHHYTRSA